MSVVAETLVYCKRITACKSGCEDDPYRSEVGYHAKFCGENRRNGADRREYLNE